MKFNIFTWNVQGNLSGNRGRSLLKLLGEDTVDIFVFQEISGDPKNYIADLKRKPLRDTYSTRYWKRTGADAKEGGYGLIWRTKKFTLKSYGFDAPIKTANPNDPKQPFLNRPPLQIVLQSVDDMTNIMLYTWHAPNEGQKAKGSYVRAAKTLFMWKPQIKFELERAGKRKHLWLLAGDLNVNAAFTGKLFPTAFGYVRRASGLDHVIAKYGAPKAMVTLKNFPLKSRPYGSDHSPLCVTVEYTAK